LRLQKPQKLTSNGLRPVPAERYGEVAGFLIVFNDLPAPYIPESGGEAPAGQSICGKNGEEKWICSIFL
jgi:hypothetical protein